MMCTAISRPIDVVGHAVAYGEKMTILGANVSYDHPTMELSEHAVMLDLFNVDGKRIGVELSSAAAGNLAEELMRIVSEADEYEATGDAR